MERLKISVAPTLTFLSISFENGLFALIFNIKVYSIISNWLS